MARNQQFDVAGFIARYASQIAQVSKQLATDFDTPAQSHINQFFARIGERRFVGKDDRWEQVTAHQNGWEYNPPPKHLMQRWASY